MNWEETIIYSFQKLLPFAKLEKFDSIKLDGLAKWYFYLSSNWWVTCLRRSSLPVLPA